MNGKLMNIKDFLEKQFAKRGLFFDKYRKKLYFPKFIELEIEQEDDKIVNYYYLSGWQFFQKIKKVYNVFIICYKEFFGEINRVLFKTAVKNGKYN